MIEIKKLSKAFDQEVIYEDLTLTLPVHQVTGIMGPSGSGKTTFLNLLAGLIQPDCGEITGIDPRRISFVFQEDRLLPWRTVKENLLFAAPVEENKMTEILELVGLSKWADAYPYALSGGMRQRVSIARAFCYPSDLLLMDEPFSSLDRTLKYQLIDALKELLKKDPRTVVWVSHDEEALKALCSVIYHLKGRPVIFERAGD